MKYYSLKNIDKKQAEYNVIVGKRSNGKTYAVCAKSLREHYKSGKRLAYIRRYAEDITPKFIKNLFAQHDIESITAGQWNYIRYYNRGFYFAKIEDKKIVDCEVEPFCQTFALNVWESAKGADNGYFDYILFDEFITRGHYLADEFIIFCNVLSSLLRDRDGTKIYMLANTVNKYCIYFSEMGISDIENMQQGEIKVYPFGYGNEKLQIAVEYCSDTENTKKVSKYFAFTNPRTKMITEGKWEIKNYPHIPKNITSDNIIYKAFVFFNHKFMCVNICEKNSEVFLTVHMQTKEFNTDNIIFDFTPNTKTNYFINLNSCDNKIGLLLRTLINKQKIFYSNNEVGELFRNWILEQSKTQQIFLS